MLRVKRSGVRDAGYELRSYALPEPGFKGIRGRGEGAERLKLNKFFSCKIYETQQSCSRKLKDGGLQFRVNEPVDLVEVLVGSN